VDVHHVTWMKTTARKQPEVQQLHFLSQQSTWTVFHTGLSSEQREAAVNYWDAKAFPKSDVKNVTCTFVSSQSATVSKLFISKSAVDSLIFVLFD